jgi:hypothetical protein
MMGHMRNPHGWTQPPRPIEVPPSWLPTDDDTTTRWKILLDWHHDDDLTNLLISWNDKLEQPFGLIPSGIGAQGYATLFSVQMLIDWYQMGPVPSQEDFTYFALNWDIPWSAFGGPLQTVMVNGTPTPMPVTNPVQMQQAWHDLDDLLTNTVIPKRANLGPLPDNQMWDETTGDLADPIIINYYDDLWIKRITYPKEAWSNAVTASSQWWNDPLHPNNFLKMEQWGTNSTDVWGSHAPAPITSTDAAWYDDGWDTRKGMGAFWDVAHVVIAVIGVVLSFTGVGAIVDALILTALSLVLSIFQGIEDQLTGGNEGAMIEGIAQAGVALAGQAFGQVSAQIPSIAKIGQAALAAFSTFTLAAAGKDLTSPDPNTGIPPSFGSGIELLEKKAMSYGPMTKDNFDVVLGLLSGNGGIAIPIAQMGWNLAQYATLGEIKAVGKLYELYTTGPVAGLWKLGADLGRISMVQAQNAGVTPGPVYPPSQLIHPSLNVVIPTGLTPMQTLMKFVREVLVPRYNLKP